MHLKMLISIFNALQSENSFASIVIFDLFVVSNIFDWSKHKPFKSFDELLQKALQSFFISTSTEFLDDFKIIFYPSLSAIIAISLITTLH